MSDASGESAKAVNRRTQGSRERTQAPRVMRFERSGLWKSSERRDPP